MELHTATARSPWGPIRVAASDRAIVAIAVLAPRDGFAHDVLRRTGGDLRPGSSPMLDRTIAAIESFIDGRPADLVALPIDLATAGAWDRAVLGGVRGLAWGEVTSYGRLAHTIGRRGAARAVGGAVGRNPIGLAIPCHRVIAGDGSLGGYGGDWFGSREALLEIKRELLAREGIVLPVVLPRV
jgi:methylated-DNA-[protein]-cysteine S-methyltransferase